MSPPAPEHHKILIVGGGSAGITTAARLIRAGEHDIAIVEPPRPSFPLINTMKPRYDMWLLKRYGLPAMYWHLMLHGRVY